jgi:Ca2+-binding RTX toxin-like protein
MTINLVDKNTATNPLTLVPDTSVSGIDPIILSPKLDPSVIFRHPGTKQVPLGDNPYVIGLSNAGWRWDTPGNVIQWNMGPTFQVPLDTKGIPPITAPAAFEAAAQTATQDALAAWASVADIHPQFNAASANITMHVVPIDKYDFGYAGYSGGPFEAANSLVFGPVLYKNLTLAEDGVVHTYMSEPLAVGGAKQKVWSVDAKTGNVGVTDTGKETFIHEIGHALGLKHPFDTGSTDSSAFPGIDPNDPSASTQEGDNKLNSKLNTIMSYSEADPPVNLPFGGAPGGPDATPMALDIAAIQMLYGANTTTASDNDTYALTDPGSPAGATWQCIWDTGGTDQIVYNGVANAVIDLRPATLDDSPTGGGMGSYTWNHTAVSRGGTIAGDITNALPDQGGVTGVLIENAQGGSGQDLVTGNDADNVLQGGSGDDVISALAGNNIINGNDGNDTMTGGLGNDVFIVDFDFVSNGSHDVITDFDSDPAGGQDFLDISGLAINDLGSFATFVQMAQVGNDTQIHIGSTQIDLLGVNTPTLDATDFRFV